MRCTLWFSLFFLETKRAHQLWAPQSQVCDVASCMERVEGFWRVHYLHNLVHASSPVLPVQKDRCKQVSNNHTTAPVHRAKNSFRTSPGFDSSEALMPMDETSYDFALMSRQFEKRKVLDI